MRSPAALLALSALAAAVPASAADPAPMPAAPPAYPMAPAPYAVPYAAPPPWARPAFVEERSNLAMRNAGIVFFSLGVATTLVGIVLLDGTAIDNACAFVEPFAGRAPPVRRGAHESLGVAREALNLCQAGPAPGAVTIGVGALLGVIGVPLFVVGNKTVLAPAPAVRLGVGSAALSWSF